MPTYEYACSACRIHLEVVQKMTEASLDTCAACGGKLRKVFHPAGILFKGSGFYATDNRSKPKTGASSGSEESSGEPSSDKSSDKASEKSSASSVDTKTEKKSGDSKSGDSKRGDSKSGDSKRGDSKPAKETA